MRQSVTGMVVVCVGLAGSPASAQRSPLVSEETHQALVNEISGDIAFEHIRWFTHYHRPMGGGEGFEAVARYVEQRAKEYGLDDVRHITLTSRTPSWSPRLGELWLITPYRRRLAFSPETALSLADYSRPTDIGSAELVDVGDGTADADYAGKAVAGNVVLATGSPGAVMNEAIWKRGALGLVYFTLRRKDFPDQLPWTRIPVENADKTRQGTFGFVLSQREGMALRAELAAAKSPYRVRVKVDSTFDQPASQAIVEAVIRGTSIHDQDIVLTGHLQEERFSANDDASGCASVLEIARSLKRMIDDGRLPRPTRDIRFWWVNEIAAEEQYFADHPEERRQILVDINQDMVGAKQSAGSRVQFVTRPPASRAGFLGDVVQSVVEAMVQGNTSYLAAVQARQVRPGGDPASGGAAATEEEPFSRPIVSRLGTHEHYDARVIPFHNNTDHQVFNMAPIGIPAVTFTNWPDDYIHSSDDDLWQIDPTQLKRNAVAVAEAAWFTATAGRDEAPGLAREMVGRGLERIGHDTRVALAMLGSSGAPSPSALARAENVVRQAVAREERAIRTLAALSPGLGPLVAAAVAALPTPDQAAARVRALAGAAGTPPAGLVAPETNAEIPALVDDVAGYLEPKGRLTRPPTLPPLMAYEALNFVDGSRTTGEIARAVAAEADVAGEWYYGRVDPADVVAYLHSAAEAGIVTVSAKTPDRAKMKGR
jgi:Peptidase family M28